MKRGAILIISLGSNIQPAENLRRAVELLYRRTELIHLASVWETQAVGTVAPNFFNSAASIQINSQPEVFKSEVLRPIEAALGRVRSSDKNAPRPIDLDPIVFNREILDDRLWNAAYLAVPIAELAPDLIDPGTGSSLAAISEKLALQTKPIYHPEVFLNFSHAPNRPFSTPE